MDQGGQLARDAAQKVARESYSRLVAFLARHTRDVAAAEDALSEAFAAALADWPQKGIPRNPEAWLMAVARRKTIDEYRRRRGADLVSDHMQILGQELQAMIAEHRPIPDERLALMFACAHPAIGSDMRSPLILQSVLGLSAEDIGSAFLVAPATMGQRLARAATLGGVGRYQLEAAIQSAHAARRVAGATNWRAIAVLYDGLFNLTGSAVVGLNRAVARAEAEGPEAGLRSMPVPDDDNRLAQFQPYWAALAELLARAENVAAAMAAYDLAIGLETDHAQRLFLLGKRDALAKPRSRRHVPVQFSPTGRI